MTKINYNLYRVPGLSLLLVLWACVPVMAQLTLNTANRTGDYSDPVSITLAPGFTTTPGGSFRAHITPGCTPLGTAPSAAQNYIITYTPRNTTTTITDPAATSNLTCDEMVSVQYFDGLGRPLQAVQVKGSPSFRDIIQPFAYDAYGREAVKYLPYALTSGTSTGGYQGNALTGAQEGFYADPPDGVSTIPNPWAVTVFEASPLNRVTQQGFPGGFWQPADPGIDDSGHTLQMGYSTNNDVDIATVASTNRVVNYEVSAINTSTQERTLFRNGFYVAGALTLTTTKNENWSGGRGNTTQEFRDKEGHVVLKRTFNTVGSTLEMLSTYYVYDDLGNLAFVLPPISEADAAQPTPTQLDNLCYQYRYDERNRLTQKRIPGKGWENMVYNKLDQMVLSQDAVQAASTSKQWTFTKYDGQGRVIMTGLWNPGTSYTRSAVQTSVNNGVQWDVKDAANASTGYSITSYPVTLLTPLVVNYYDDYTGIIDMSIAGYVPAMTASAHTRGLLTATRTAILNTPANILLTLNYYDEQGRIQEQFKQHYLGGVIHKYNYDHVVTGYSFTDEVLSVAREHYKNVSGTKTLALKVTDKYEYDHMGRKTNTRKQIQNGGQAADSDVVIAQLEYNEIGQTEGKHLHQVGSATSDSP